MVEALVEGGLTGRSSCTSFSAVHTCARRSLMAPTHQLPIGVACRCCARFTSRLPGTIPLFVQWVDLSQKKSRLSQ